MQFQKGHQTNLGRKNGPLSKEHRKILSDFAKKRKGVKASNWRGGRRYSNGYILVYKPAHPFCVDKKYVMEHRLVMEKHIGRYLKKGEVVHHLNGVRDDNRMSNLQLLKKKEHDRITTKERWLNGSFKPRPNMTRDIHGRFASKE